MHLNHLCLGACVAATLAGSAAAQGEPAGYVKTASGEAFVVSDGQATPATPGMAFRAGNDLRTGAGGTLGVTFKDNTLVSLGPQSLFRIDTFSYAPAQGALGLAGTLTRGTFSYVSGVIARLRPEAVQVRTPTSVIGVRGTEFAIKVEQP